MADNFYKKIPKSNFDELNEKGYTVVKGKPAAPIKDYELVKGKPEAPIRDYEVVKGKPEAPIRDYEVVKGKPAPIENPITKVSAKSDFAKALESHSSQFEQDAQGLKKAFQKGEDVVGKFRGPMAGAIEAEAGGLGKALKSSGKMLSKFGPVAAVAGTILGGMGGAMAAEPGHILEGLKSGASEGLEGDVFGAFAPEKIANSEVLKPEDYKKLREDKARPEALDFGKRFAKALKTGKF